jgi:hypothetical protein
MRKFTDQQLADAKPHIAAHWSDHPQTNIVVYAYDESQPWNDAVALVEFLDQVLPQQPTFKPGEPVIPRSMVHLRGKINGRIKRNGILVAGEPASEAQSLCAALIAAGIPASIANLQKIGGSGTDHRRVGTGELMIEVWPEST